MALRYIDWAYLTARYPDAARIGGAEVLGPAWIEAAEAEVDARLASRYVVPFANTPAPALIMGLCADIAYVRMNAKQKWATAMEESIDRRFEQIVNGTMQIVGAEASGSNLASCSGAGMASAFGMDDPVKWRISSNWPDAYPADRELYE